MIFLALLAFHSGTFAGAATAGGALAHQAALLALCLWGAATWRDPWRLGPGLRWLPAVLLGAVTFSVWLSPVPRAGRVGLLLLPAYLLLPAAAARAWRSANRRRSGSVALSVLLLAVGGTALMQWQMLSLPRAALPLGHHTLLAAWLVLILPSGVCAARTAGPSRWLAVAAGALGLAALAATGSLLGALGAAAQLVVLSIALPGLRRWMPLAALPVLPFVPRLGRVLAGLDPSGVARAAYLEAGWEGVLSRPWSGFGPGSTPWTLAEWMRPVAGLHPPSEIIGDLHSLPVQWLYELGWPGALLAVAAGLFFARRRIAEIGERRSPEGVAALAGLIGFAVVALGVAPFSVPALPAALAVIGGLALSAAGGEERRPFRPVPVLVLAVVYVLPAVWLLAPLDRAHLSYERATRAASASEALAAMGKARRLDPDFPLYRAREAWLALREEGPSAETARQALLAARAARGLAPLWLGAGEVAAAASHSAAPQAFHEAQRLDPLSPLAAFHAMAADSAVPGATALGVRAVVGDRRLARAVWWAEHPDLAARVSASAGIPIQTEIPGGIERYRLGLTLDRTPALSFSLYAFRRSPWIWTLAPVEITDEPPQALPAGE